MNYQQSNITGESWKRAYRVIINNEYQSIPRIEFFEEKVVNIEGSIIKQNDGSVAEQFTEANATETFDIKDEEGNVIDTKTYLEVYSLLQSLYLHLAAKRDATQ